MPKSQPSYLDDRGVVNAGHQFDFVAGILLPAVILYYQFFERIFLFCVYISDLGNDAKTPPPELPLKFVFYGEVAMFDFGHVSCFDAKQITNKNY